MLWRHKGRIKEHSQRCKWVYIPISAAGSRGIAPLRRDLEFRLTLGTTACIRPAPLTAAIKNTYYRTSYLLEILRAMDLRAGLAKLTPHSSVSKF